MGDYIILIRVRGYPGWFKYIVKTKEQAMDHFAAIVSGGYRRINDRRKFEWYAPSTIEMIRIEGEGLETNYPDEAIRT